MTFNKNIFNMDRKRVVIITKINTIYRDFVELEKNNLDNSKLEKVYKNIEKELKKEIE